MKTRSPGFLNMFLGVSTIVPGKYMKVNSIIKSKSCQSVEPTCVRVDPQERMRTRNLPIQVYWNLWCPCTGRRNLLRPVPPSGTCVSLLPLYLGCRSTLLSRKPSEVNGVPNDSCPGVELPDVKRVSRVRNDHHYSESRTTLTYIHSIRKGSRDPIHPHQGLLLNV